jgi:signal transduction histidine kinase
MNHDSNPFNHNKIIGNDPIAVKLLRDAYEKMIAIPGEHNKELSATIAKIESTYNKSSNHDDLRMSIILEEAQELLDEDKINPAQRKHLFNLLEKLIFLRETDDEISVFFDKLNENIHSLLRLDFDNDITFPTGGTRTSNLLDLISGSLMLIKEKYERAVVSTKAINKITSINPEQLVIITDVKGKIRFLDGNAEQFLNTTLVEAVHSNISNYLPEMNGLKGIFGMEIKDHEIILKDKDGLPNTFNVTLKSTEHEAEYEDEIIELAFLFVKSTAKVQHGVNAAREYHDRLAPLNTILGAAQILQDITVYHEEAKGCSDVIYENALMLKEATKKILSSLTSDEDQNAEKGEIDFDTILKRTFKSVEFIDGRKDIEIITNIDDTSGFESDPKLLLSIFKNLITNGIKYRKTSKSDDVQSVINVTVSKTSHIDGVLILVEDNGLGMDKQNNPNIFSNRFQVDSSKEGFGLGLTLVHEAVQQLNGVIEMESTLGYGTTFIIQLPTSSH